MILVTGAGGKTGRAVVSALSARHAPVRALVRRREQEPCLRNLGAWQVRVGDMADPATWRAAAAGVDAIYHICPNMHPEEIEIGRLALQAALLAGQPRFVYHSVLHPETESMPHHWNKLRVEELVLESGLPFTVVQPAAYMQNVLAGWDTIVADGIYRVPYAPETRLGMVDLMDVAWVAASALLQRRHSGATYQLCGPQIHSQTDIAMAMGRALDRQVRVEQVPLDRWEHDVRQSGMDQYAVDTLKAMFRFYERHGFWGNANTLRWLLGREPTPLDRFLRREVEARSAR